MAALGGQKSGQERFRYTSGSRNSAKEGSGTPAEVEIQDRKAPGTPAEVKMPQGKAPVHRQKSKSSTGKVPVHRQKSNFSKAKLPVHRQKSKSARERSRYTGGSRNSAPERSRYTGRWGEGRGLMQRRGGLRRGWRGSWCGRGLFGLGGAAAGLQRGYLEV